jgi:predicted MFS family arabinose efflux permease
VTNIKNNNASTGAIVTACMLSAIGIACWNLLPVTLGSAADAYLLKDQQIGLLGSSLLTGWVLATVPAFFYMHTMDRKWVTIIGALVAALGSAASQFVDTVSLLYLTWGFAGFGMAMVFCVSIQLITELGNIERSFGLKLVSEVTGGAVLVYAFPVFIISVWHYVGASYGVAAVYLSAIFFLRWVTPYSPKENKAMQNNKEPAPLVAWLALAGFLIFLCGVTGLWAFLERIGTDIGVTPNQMGTLLGILKLVGGLAGLTVIYASAKYGVRWPQIVAFLCVLIGVSILHLTQSIAGYAAGTWIWEYGFSLGTSYQFAAIARLDTSKRLVLLIPTCIGLAGMIGPALAGYLKRGDSYANIYIFAVIFALVSFVIFMFIFSKKRLALMFEQE